MHNPERPGFHGRYVQGVQVEHRVSDGQHYHKLEQQPGEQASVSFNRLFIHVVGKQVVFVDRQVLSQLLFTLGMRVFFGHVKSCLEVRR